MKSRARVSRIASSLRSTRRHLFVALQDGLDDQLEHEAEPPLAEVGLGGRGTLVEKADGIKKDAQLAGDSPGRMAVGFPFGLDVSAHFDQCDQAKQPCAVLLGGIGRLPADLLAELARSFGSTGRGGEVEPGAFEKQLGLVGLGPRLVDACIHELLGSLKQLCQSLAVGVQLLELELIAIELEDGQARFEPVRGTGVDGGPQFQGPLALRVRRRPSCRAASGPRRWTDRRGNRESGARVRRCTLPSRNRARPSATDRPRARALSMPALARSGVGPGLSATWESSASASANLPA